MVGYNRLEVELNRSEITDTVKDVTASLAELPQLSIPERLQEVDSLKERMGRLKQVLRSYQGELASIPQDSAKEERKLAKTLAEQVRALDINVKAAERQAKKDSLVDGKELEPFDHRKATTRQVVDQTHKEYDGAMATTGRIQDVLNDTNKVADSTIAQLESDRERLNNINNMMSEVKDNLGKADRLLRAFVMRMSTDKLIMFWLFLIVVVVFVIVVYKAIKS